MPSSSSWSSLTVHASSASALRTAESSLTAQATTRHARRSVRLRGYDYASTGVYFLTLCTHKRRPLFGTISEGNMRLAPLGVIVREEWLRTPLLRHEIALDAFVIMPDHMHAIVLIHRPHVGATGRLPTLMDDDPTISGPSFLHPDVDLAETTDGSSPDVDRAGATDGSSLDGDRTGATDGSSLDVDRAEATDGSSIDGDRTGATGRLPLPGSRHDSSRFLVDGRPDLTVGSVDVDGAPWHSWPMTQSARGTTARLRGPGARSLGAFVGGFKAATTARINEARHTPRDPVWQRNFYEHIIRDQEDWRRIRHYIEQNPARWARRHEVRR